MQTAVSHVLTADLLIYTAFLQRPISPLKHRFRIYDIQFLPFRVENGNNIPLFYRLGSSSHTRWQQQKRKNGAWKPRLGIRSMRELRSFCAHRAE